MKKISVLLLLIFASMVSAADAQTSVDPNAKKILDEASAKFKTFKTPQASFNIQTEDVKGKTLSVKKGTVTIKGNYYRIVTANQENFSDGKTVWSYDKNDNTVTIDEADVSSNVFAPQNLFGDFYEKNFLYKLNGDKKFGAKTLHEIEMAPLDKSKNYHKLYLLIDKQVKTLYSAKILEKNGIRTTYTINSLNASAAVTDAEMTFVKSKYPGVKTTDLRKDGDLRRRNRSIFNFPPNL